QPFGLQPELGRRPGTAGQASRRHHVGPAGLAMARHDGMEHSARRHAHLFMTGLTGRVAIVTGASRGIGQAIAAWLAAAGATGGVGFRADPAAAERLAASVVAGGGPAEAVPLDVTDAGQAGRVVADVARRHGRIDVLVNNAGILPRTSFLDVELEEWEAVLR